MIDKALIENYLTPLTVSIDVSDPVWKAWRVMKNQQVKQLPVEKEGKIVGIVSDKDIVQISGYNGGQSMAVKEAMSLNPLVLVKTVTIDQALRAMLSMEQQHAIVVDELNQLCGLFSWDRAFHFFIELIDMGQWTRIQKQGGYCD